MADPASELERLQRLEFAGEQSAYADMSVACCPVCWAVMPEDRRRWQAEPGRLAGAEQEPGGPRHAADCWLAARIRELEAEEPRSHGLLGGHTGW